MFTSVFISVFFSILIQPDNWQTRKYLTDSKEKEEQAEYLC